MNKITIPLGFDAHTHQRSGAMMKTVLPFMVKTFPDFLAMPNLEGKGLITGEEAMRYKEDMVSVADFYSLPCRPLVTIKYDPVLTTPEVVRHAKSLGVTAIKFYPDGVTTNSSGGVRNFKLTYPILEAAQDCGLMVLWHGEHPDSEIMEREVDFLGFFEQAVSDFPDLKQVLEHLSTWQSVRLIQKLSRSTIGATITAHHLWWTLTDMAGGNFKTNLMCKPILKNKKDRDALRDAAMGGNPSFFFGSDSAPHPASKKRCDDVCSGVFTAPYSLSMLAEIFEQAGKIEMLEGFVSIHGRKFYGLDFPTQQTTLVRQPWKGPEYFGKEGTETMVLNAAKDITFNWKVVE